MPPHLPQLLIALALLVPLAGSARNALADPPPEPEPEQLADPAQRATWMPDTTGTSEVAHNEERVRLVTRLLHDLPHAAQLGSITRFIDPARWLLGIRNELTPPPGAAATARFRFRCFITPEVDAVGEPREYPFALDEMLRRSWRNTLFDCVGELPDDRLVFEATRSDGATTERWRVVFWLAKATDGRWIITRIDDPRHLRFCLVEDRKPPRKPVDGDAAATDRGPAWLLLPPVAAREACVNGTDPVGAARLERETFAAMSLSDPLMPPYLLIESIDLARSRLMVGSQYGDGIAIGERILCYAQRPYRLVALDAHRAVFENWAGYRFTLDKRTQTVDPPDPDFHRLPTHD